MTTITNYDIMNIAQQLRIPLIGVFSKDKLPYARYDGGYVVNLQDDADAYGNFNEGSHWTCFYIRGKQAVYFDSFGIIAPRQVQEFLRPYKPFAYNTKQIQDIHTKSCGWYCLFFLYWMSHQSKMKSSLATRLNLFCELFSDDTKKNKSLLEKYLGRIIK